ncbi:MAG: c(7)-type cytochrome triheme domain-containing protein [Thermodesulfobacteriota bacterium]
MKKLLALCVIAVYVSMSPAAAARKTVGGGDLRFTPKDVRQVVFSHESHMKMRGIKCASCHYRVFQMAHGSWKMKMEKMTKGDFCGKCHDGRIAFPVNDREFCSRCHQ